MASDNNPIRYSDLISPDDSITKLIDQLTQLNTTYGKMSDDIKREAAELAKALNAVSGATETGRTVTKKAASDADRLAKAQRELTFAESENAKQLAELRLATHEQNQINKLLVKINNTAEGSYNRLSAQYSLNKIYINNMTQAERDAAEASEGLITRTRELYEEMKRMQEETGKYQLNVGNYPQLTAAVAGYSDKALEAVGLNNEVGKSLLALGQGGDEAKAVFTAMGDGAKALGKTLLGLLSNPVFIAIAGIAGAGAAFKWWYDYNAGLVEATRLTQQFTGKEGDNLQAYRNEVQAVADAFDVDFKETLIAANAVAQQFGVSADEALKLIQDGFVAGGNANGEFLDTLKEYPAYFKEAGISADQFVAIVAQTNKAGIFSDKGVDAIKEANLRLREMTTSTADALDAIGISSVQVQTDLQTGAKTTFEVMQDVSARLNELPDSAQAVGAAIADIFGGAGEDAGLQYLRTLKDISTNIDEVKGKAGLLGQLQEEQLQSQIELQNALSGLFDLTGGTFETLTTRVKVFVNEGLTAVIKGVINLINYFIDFYNRSVAFRVLWQGIVAGFKNAFDAIGNLFNAFGDVLQATGKLLKGAFTLDWDTFKEGVTQYAMAIPNMIKAQMKDTADNFKEGLENINKEIKPITIPVSVGDTPTNGRGTPVTTATPTVDTSAKDKAAKAAEREAERQAKAVENAYKKNLEATRKLQDAQLALEKDGWKKRVAETKLNFSRQIEDLKHQLATDKELTVTGREAINATIKALEQQQTEELLKIENERQMELLEVQKKGIELRLAAVKVGSEQERQLRLQLIETEKQMALLQNQQLPTGQQQEAGVISAGFDVQKSDVADEYLNAQLAIFDQQQALAQSEFDLLRNSEERKTQFRLQAEKDRLQKILELNKTAANQLTDLEVATIENTIKKIDQEIEQSKGKERSGDLYGLFGLNLDDDQKTAIDTSVAYAVDALQTYLDAYAAAADAKVELADKEVEEAKTVLEAEIEARNKGYANNVVMAQKELDAAKKNQEKALAEQRKAQKAQAAIQTIQQIGNLVTSTAMIWAQLGFPWAIPAIAVMWGSFAASKIKAAQLAKQTESYGDGTVELLAGGSHQSGNDIDLGMKPDGTRRRAEGGEFFAVINKRNSRRFRAYIPDVIKSFNNGTFADKYLHAYDGANGFALNVQGGDPDLSDLKNDVRAIREQNQRRTYTDGDGRTVVEYKNLKRKIS